jgi:YteA family regulatory protein
MENKYLGLREHLLRERENIIERLEANDEMQLNRSLRDSDGELSAYDNHPADAGSQLYERSKDLALIEHERHYLEEIEAALERMEKGTYGRCRQCAEEIKYERMEAMPTAAYCMQHQKAPKYTSQRPVEEEVLTGFHQFNFDGSDDETQFDAEDAWQSVARFNELPLRYEEDIDADEFRGVVDPVEGYIITDLEGNTIDDK